MTPPSKAKEKSPNGIDGSRFQILYHVSTVNLPPLVCVDLCDTP